MEFWGQEGFREKVNFRNDPVHTPRLNDFARESVVLTSAMSNCPLSSPHRGSLLTGMYPNKSGIPLNCNSSRPISSLREDAVCVSDVFCNAGYDCAYFGKLHADFPTPNDPERPGQYVEDRVPAWDAYTPKERRHGFNYWYSYGTFDEHKNPHYWDTEGRRHDPREWSPLHESGKVVSYLKNEGNVRDPKKPFFIMVGMNPPHSPYRSLDDCMEEDFNLYKNQPLDSLLVRPNADSKMLKAESARYYFASVTGVGRAFGQVPGGMFGADENARIGFFDPRQGTETCGFVEQMASDEIMLLISGDPYWADHLEDVAFNSYPASLMPDYRALRYLTCPNMAISDSRNHHPGLDNSGPFLAMNPFSSRCCQHNHGFGWPYYVEHLVLATPDNGVAAVLYNSCKANVKVGDGTEITLREQTNYPFEEMTRFTVGTSENVSFPFYLRIPSWCKNASVLINGKKQQTKLAPGTYACIEREWKDGDEVVLNLPMEYAVRQWQVNKNSVSVDYGPLTLSLKIEEEYKQMPSTETAVWDSKWQEGADASAWPTFEILPASPWNYALRVQSPITLQRRNWPSDNNPFTLSSVPMEFKAQGRLVPEWKIDEYGLCGVLPYENARKSDCLDEITLVPMGAARLRISAFPVAER